MKLKDLFVRLQLPPPGDYGHLGARAGGRGAGAEVAKYTVGGLDYAAERELALTQRRRDVIE